MSKQLFVDPNERRASGVIHFEDIPVCTYKKTVKDEVGNFTKEQLVNIYRDMLTLREFETMINEIKINGQYCGVAYNHPGPAHLSMGQEAAAVGEAFHLDVNDFIFGSHRAHSRSQRTRGSTTATRPGSRRSSAGSLGLLLRT